MGESTNDLAPLGLAALRLKVPSTWLRGEALAGRVPCLQAGSRMLFDVAVVRELLAERARQPAQAGQEPRR